eukprot:scaffold69_cov248-Pinguiococcus_pyrenoidosus.AAC.32
MADDAVDFKQQAKHGVSDRSSEKARASEEPKQQAGATEHEERVAPRKRERRKRVVNGWGESDTKVADVDTPKAEVDSKSVSKSRRSVNSVMNSATPTEILFIPDLDEEAEEDLSAQVATAPKNTSKRMPSFNELERDLEYVIPTSDSGIDLTPLSRTLVPASAVREGEERWTFDSLLLEVHHSLGHKENLRQLQKQQEKAAEAQRKRDFQSEEAALAKIDLVKVSGDGEED